MFNPMQKNTFWVLYLPLRSTWSTAYNPRYSARF